jgi:hypothetical protein
VAQQHGSRSASEPTNLYKSSRVRHSAASRFFIRIGQVGRASEPRDPYTLPLFPLVLILDADGSLAADARHLLG